MWWREGTVPEAGGLGGLGAHGTAEGNECENGGCGAALGSVALRGAGTLDAVAADSVAAACIADGGKKGIRELAENPQQQMRLVQDGRTHHHEPQAGHRAPWHTERLAERAKELVLLQVDCVLACNHRKSTAETPHKLEDRLHCICVRVERTIEVCTGSIGSLKFLQMPVPAREVHHVATGSDL